MKVGLFLQGFVAHFLLVFMVGVAVSFLYGLVVHGQGIVDWGISVRLALVLGIALPLVRQFEKKG
jgi:hypothetical protein